MHCFNHFLKMISYNAPGSTHKWCLRHIFGQVSVVLIKSSEIEDTGNEVNLTHGNANSRPLWYFVRDFRGNLPRTFLRARRRQTLLLFCSVDVPQHNGRF